jgi:hydrogenase-4 component F
VFVIFLIVVFIGFLSHFRSMYFGESAEGQGPKLSGLVWRVLPMWLAFIPLLVLGLWWPRALWSVFTRISSTLLGGGQ